MALWSTIPLTRFLVQYQLARLLSAETGAIALAFTIAAPARTTVVCRDGSNEHPICLEGFMALISCPDCNHKISDSAASCPNCGRIMLAYNDLNFPSYHVATVALVIAVLAPAIPATAPWWLKIAASGSLALIMATITWIWPAIAERVRLRKLLRQSGSKGTKYSPRKDVA